MNNIITIFVCTLLLCCIYYVTNKYYYNKNNAKKKVYNPIKKENESNMSKIFSNIYKTNFWGKGSGFGSFKECTVDYRIFLNKFILDNNIKKIIDFGCGDWQMLSHFNFSSDVYYYGYDVVKSVVQQNNNTYRKENINFYHLNNIEDPIESGEMIMAKDVLQHWENKYIKYFLDKILPKYRYAIIVNDFKSNTENRDIKIGKCRPLNLEESPFFYSGFSSHIDMKFCKFYLKRIYIKK